MWNKITALPTGAKWMIVVMIVALICVATRWKYICEEASDAFRNRFQITAPQSDTLEQRATDSL